MLRIACLHTAESNIAVLDSALRDLEPVGVALRHSVHADLLAAAEEAGGLTSPIIEQTGDVLSALYNEADVFLLTCSTLGPAAEAAAESAPIPVLRVDAALAHKAVKDGGKVAVLCAVETTLEPTRLLFEKAAQATGAEVVMWLVPDAWEAFKAGDRNRYLSLIAQAADEATRNGATQVALAQASMAGAVDLTSTGRHPLNSPTVGFTAAIEATRPWIVGATHPAPGARSKVLNFENSHQTGMASFRL